MITIADASEGGDGLVTPEDTDEKPLDRAMIENLIELGGPEMISELTEMFFEDPKSALFALREALTASDARSV